MDNIDLNNVNLIKSQSKEGLKNTMKFRQQQLAERNIITKTVLQPVKDANGNTLKGEDGQPVMRMVTIPVHIPEVEKEAIKVFVDSIPCWFDGCQKIRDDYKNELKANQLEPGCTSCKKGNILRKYLKIAVSILQARDKGNI